MLASKGSGWGLLKGPSTQVAIQASRLQQRDIQAHIQKSWDQMEWTH